MCCKFALIRKLDAGTEASFNEIFDFDIKDSDYQSNIEVSAFKKLIDKKKVTSHLFFSPSTKQ